MVRIKVTSKDPHDNLILKAVDKPYEPPFAKRDPMKDKKKANKPKRSIKPKGPRIPEKVIQSQVESYLTLLGITPIRLPDSLFTAIFAPKIKTKTGWKTQSVPLHVKALISKYISGLPDLIIPLITEKGTLILPLELKAIGGTLGPKQVKWQRELNTVVAYSFEEAKTLIDNFLKGD